MLPAKSNALAVARPYAQTLPGWFLSKAALYDA
jgi:hypothetical protein